MSVLLPYQFFAPAGESLTWQTNILTSRDGTEQRRRLRGAARQRFAVDIQAPGPTERNRIDNLLWHNRGAEWQLPIWTEARHPGAAIGSGNTVITVSTLYGDFRTGGYVLLWASPSNCAVKTIASKTDTTLTLSTTAGAAYSTSAFVVPVHLARLVDDPTRKSTGFNADGRAQFEVLTGLDDPASAEATQYGGLDVLLEEPDLPGQEATDQYTERVDVLDLGGVTQTWAPYDNPKNTRIVRYTLEGLEDIWAWRRRLHRWAGAWRPFWAPTWECNLRLRDAAYITDTFVVLFDAFRTEAAERTHLMIELTSGTIELREVVSLSLLGGGDHTEVEVDSALGVYGSEIARISFMSLRRLAGDTVTLRWVAPALVVLDLTLQEVSP
jgi:hypothetical protein